MPWLPHSAIEFRYPTMLPAAVVALVLATALCTAVARRLGTRRSVAWLLVASVGAILALTIAPSRIALDGGPTLPMHCDFSRFGPAPLASYLVFDDPIVNVLIFVPLGLAIAWLPPRPRRILLVAALLFPVAIETTQALVATMGRACESGDVFDNDFGLVFGLVIGLVLARIARRTRVA